MGAGSSRRLLVALLVAVVVLLAVVAAGRGGTAEATASESAATLPTDTFSAGWDANTAPVPAVDADTSANFEIFRNRPATGMPKEAVEHVGSSSRYGRNAALARAIDTPNGTGWVIPGNGFICIAMKDPGDGYGTACVPTAVAVRLGVLLRMGSDRGDQRVAEVVMVPDGQRAVRSDGTSVPLRDGIASVVSYGAGELRASP